MPGRRIFLFANGDCHDLSFYRQQINPDDRVISVNGGAAMFWRWAFVPLPWSGR